ncbi:hypothetical protein IUY40_15580 [Flavobacterium sp. ALJ2]|uniref:hypothetical protein n=1 Tax=Flavobacterium sp. ALJ2 TaxID=2786960 RepID=UPI00189FCF88|nr:hypothetical protein [Flavobacterium sp. ALJ2]MBF7092954.1 hypothetical protein [Flavobacterium sp. ALJ2]
MITIELLKKIWCSTKPYTKVTSVFNDMIKDWDEHLEKLIDFWEANLFAAKKTQRLSY